jgi:hypothetical protein
LIRLEFQRLFRIDDGLVAEASVFSKADILRDLYRFFGGSSSELAPVSSTSAAASAAVLSGFANFAVLSFDLWFNLVCCIIGGFMPFGSAKKFLYDVNYTP